MAISSNGITMTAPLARCPDELWPPVHPTTHPCATIPNQPG
jgi:hypothetical protein